MAPLRPSLHFCTTTSRVPRPSQICLSTLTPGVRWQKCRPEAMEQGRRGYYGCLHCRGASSGDFEGEQNERILALEAEIFDFMEKSSKPCSFPTKEELIAAQRMDLVEAIVDHGGWLAYGWDLDDGVGFEDDSEEQQSDSIVVEGEGTERIFNSPGKERRFSHPEAGSRLSDSNNDDDDWVADSQASSSLGGQEPLNLNANQARSDSSELHIPLEIDRKSVYTNLQQLESELSSVLGSLGYLKNRNLNTEERSEELNQLSDELEFKETETANVQEKLRSIRAKLSALEGKMTLRTAEAQRVLAEKQRRLDAAKRALSALSTAYVTWPGIGSEVFLAGSFDGWTTQRKMEKSNAGVFSLVLTLYPGQYEIKFIVDGVWRVDPLRPVIDHSGFENNLLVVS